jgi:signal transduction histidine kinase
MASHDLKNPLSRILGYVHLLEDRVSGDEKMTRYVSQIHKSAQEMEQLIMEILSVERARRGMLEHRRFNLANMVQSIFQRNKMDAENKRQQITLELSSETVMMEGDEQQLRQAFLNLIGNAIKYTPEEGTITVRLSVPEEERIRFEVEDTGYGIPKHAQDRLFTEFYRVRTPETAGISGTGLGLSLVRSVVESHGGLVAVVSEEGAGSKFTIDLPRTGAKPDDS